MKAKAVAVIGGGSAGFTAERSHRISVPVASSLFFMGATPEHASLCIYAGCMPSKALTIPPKPTSSARSATRPAAGWAVIPLSARKNNEKMKLTTFRRI
jgi:pyruvate/2-oxoglutarate dehydrogenase complex dihydrolipoamide dehydrogenase (E3) component